MRGVEEGGARANTASRDHSTEMDTARYPPPPQKNSETSVKTHFIKGCREGW